MPASVARIWLFTQIYILLLFSIENNNEENAKLR